MHHTQVGGIRIFLKLACLKYCYPDMSIPFGQRDTAMPEDTSNLCIVRGMYDLGA